MENKERTITKTRHKVKVRDRDNVLMSAVAGQMEGGARPKDDQEHLDASPPSMTRGSPTPTTQIVRTDGPSMLRLMGVRDVMTFVQKGTENKEKMITNNRDKDKDRDRYKEVV